MFFFLCFFQFNLTNVLLKTKVSLKCPCHDLEGHEGNYITCNTVFRRNINGHTAYALAVQQGAKQVCKEGEMRGTKGAV